MLLLPIRTPLLHPGDDLIEILRPERPRSSPDGRPIHPTIQPSDILVLSSKALATVEDAMIDLQKITPSTLAADFSRRTGRSPEFCQAMLNELDRLHGTIVSTCPGAALTELRPDGLSTGTILVANAGLDESNVQKGFAIGWPKDPVKSVARLRMELEKRLLVSGFWFLDRATSNKQQATNSLAIILSDSCCTPRRTGVTAIALTVNGLDPLQSMKGKKDLFGKPLTITTEAIADQLATAANFVMGNAGQSVPAVIVRDHGLELSDWEGWVPGIEKNEDLFRGIFSSSA